MNFTLGLCKPKGAPKYIKASHSWLWKVATSSASPPKAKSSPLGACTLTVHVKIVACPIVSEDGPMEIVLGGPWGGILMWIFVPFWINKWRTWRGIHAPSFTQFRSYGLTCEDESHVLTFTWFQSYSWWFWCGNHVPFTWFWSYGCQSWDGGHVLFTTMEFYICKNFRVLVRSPVNTFNPRYVSRMDLRRQSLSQFDPTTLDTDSDADSKYLTDLWDNWSYFTQAWPLTKCDIYYDKTTSYHTFGCNPRSG